MARLIVNLPLGVPVTKKGKLWPLNMNRYLTTHNMTLAKAKIAFAAIAMPMLKGHPPFTSQVSLTYSLYRGTAHQVDVSNVCCVADKFFSDCLTKAGLIPDDNSSVIQRIQYLWGGIDRANPRIEVVVDDLSSSQGLPPMKIMIDQAELDAVVREHIESQISLKPGQTFTVSYTDAGIEVRIVKATGSEATAGEPEQAEFRHEVMPAYVPERADTKSPVFEMPYAASEQANHTEAAKAFIASQVILDEDVSTLAPQSEQDEDPRFAGKTRKQIAGIKGADSRAANKAKAQAQTTPSIPQPIPHAVQQAIQEEAKATGLVQPMDNVPVQPQPEPDFSTDDNLFENAVTPPASTQGDGSLSFADVGDTLDPGAELDRQMDDRIGPTTQPVFPSGELGRLLQEAQAKSAAEAAAAESGGTMRSIFADITTGEKDEPVDHRSLFAELMGR